MTEPSALHRSTTYGGMLPNATAAPISPQTTSEAGVPRFRWPSQAAAIPTRCPREHCGSRLLEADPPTPEGLLGEVRCYACSRVVAELTHDGYRRMTPEQFAALPVKVRMPAPRPAREPVRQRRDAPCPDCGTHSLSKTSVRCMDCEVRRRQQTALSGQLVALLTARQVVHRDTIARELGITHDVLRKVVTRARARGYMVATTGASGHYRLVDEEAQP